jgi:hypothetical protein
MGASQDPFFLPVKVLSRVFRGKFVNRLKRAFRKKKLQFPPANAALEQPKLFLRFLRTLFREDWVVYAKPAFAGARKVLRYLGRYTHRVAISNHRLLAFDGERVTFRWKDYARGNKQRQMTLTATEFLRRFLQHVLPRGFVRIRPFGFLANSCRTARLRLIRELLPQPREPPCAPLVSEARTWNCPRCGEPMANRCSPYHGGVSLSVQFLRQLVDVAPIGPMTYVRVPAWSCVYRLINAGRLPAFGTFRLSNITNGHLTSSTGRPFRRTPHSSVQLACIQTSL